MATGGWRVNVDTRDIAHMLKKRAPEVFRDAMFVGSFNMVNHIRGLILDEYAHRPTEHGTPIKDRGGYGRSIDNPQKSISKIMNGQELTIGVPYASVLESGRRPAGIPRAVIEDTRAGLAAWVKRKMRPTPDPERNQRRNKRFYVSVAYAIAHNKARKRTPARPIVKPAMARSGREKRFQKFLDEAVTAAMKQFS